MGAVVDAVSDVFSGAVDFVQQAGEEIGNAVDAVGQEVSNLGSTLGDIVQKVVKDPWATLTAVAATATGNAWAVPLIYGADTAIKGGDPADIAKSMATSYAAQYVGAQVGSAVGGQFAEAGGSGISSGAGQVMGEGIGSGVSTGTQAGLSVGSSLGSGVGQNLGSLTQSGIQAATQNISVTAAMGKLASNIAGSGAANTAAQLIQTGKVDPNKVLSAMASGGVNAGVNLISSYIPGFNSLPPTVQRMAIAAMSSELNGRDPTTAVVNMALSAGLNEIGKALSSSPELKNTYESASKLSDANEAYNSASADYTQKLNDYNAGVNNAQSLYDQLNSVRSEYDSTLARYNASNDQNEVNQLGDRLRELNSQYQDLTGRYTAQTDSLSGLRDDISSLANKASGLRQDYLVSAIKVYDPNYDAKALATSIDQQTKDAYAGKSLEDIYFTELNKNPEAKLYTNWNDLIQNTTDPSKIGTIDDLYKQATGFDLAAGTGNIDPLTWSVYQDNVAGSAPWYLAEAEKAKQAGDFTKYSQLMGELNQTYSGAYGESLGYSATDKPEISSNFLKSMLGSVLQQKAQQVGAPVKATSGTWSPTVTPTSDPTKLVRSYGFGGLNPYVTDLMTKEEAANSFLRDKYVYDPLAVENRLSNITTMDFSSQPTGALDAFKSQFPDAFVAGGRMFLPKGLQQDVVNQFNSVGTSGYNNLTGNTSALDYLKGGAAGGLGSYFKAFDNPYATQLTRSAPVGGLSQVASSWGQSSGVSSPLAQNMLAKNLIS